MAWVGIKVALAVALVSAAAVVAASVKPVLESSVEPKAAIQLRVDDVGANSGALAAPGRKLQQGRKGKNGERLLEAILDGNVSLAKRLIKRVDVNARVPSGDLDLLPLEVAIYGFNDDLIAALIDADANVSEADVVVAAVTTNQPEIVALLLANGLDADFLIDDLPLVLFAAGLGNTEIVQVVKDAGAKFDDEDLAASECQCLGKPEIAAICNC